MQSFKQAAKTLEEMSVSCRGLERILLLRRWLVALKETERDSVGSSGNDHQVTENSSDEFKDSPRRQTVVSRPGSSSPFLQQHVPTSY